MGFKEDTFVRKLPEIRTSVCGGGMARQEILNMALVFFYHPGVPPSILKRFCRDSLEEAR